MPTRTWRAPWALAAAASSAAGVALAAFHPLSGSVAVGVWMAVAAAAFAWPQMWLLALPAALPLLGLAPWTGWMVVEEFDLAVLAVAAGGYAAAALPRAALPRAAAPGTGAGAQSLALPFFVGCCALSVLVAVQRGVADAGGWQWGWWQAYHEPLNSLRLGKSFFLALLLLPLWRAACRAAPEAAPRRLTQGLAAGLAVAGLLVLWERAAFPGLLNFSTDYRVSALFWEMHVGGAALDAFLAMTMPFALAAALQARGGWAFAAATAALVLGAYAGMATFSRILFVAVPLALLVTWVLDARRRGTAQAARSLATLPAALLVAGFAAGAAWIFDTSGYRGMLAVVGGLAAMLALLPLWRAAPRPALAAGAALGVLLCGGVGVSAALLPKGAYLAYCAAAALLGAVFVAWRRQVGRLSTAGPMTDAAITPGGPRDVAARRAAAALAPRAAPAPAPALPAVLASAGFVALLGAALAVALHWGARPAFDRMLPVVALLAAAAVSATLAPRPPWPASLRWQASATGLLGVTAIAVGLFAGGAAMSSRVAAAGGDATARLAHWRGVLALLRGPLDVAIGRGLGRFPGATQDSAAVADRTGDHRLIGAGAGEHVALTGGGHEIDWGQVYRLSQRIAPPTGALVLELDVRTDGSTGLHADVCNKHLLYDSGCVFGNVQVEARPGVWQRLRLPLPGAPPDGGSRLAPRLVAFSIGVMTRGGRIEIDNLSLQAGGREMLSNGRFDAGLARWFFSSDRHHMPWHEKSLPMHVLLAQGVAGLLLLAGLCAAALWRLSLGAARGHPLAPPLAGALLGILTVGAIDSLLDAPRIGFLIHLLLLAALALPGQTPTRPKP